MKIEEFELNHEGVNWITVIGVPLALIANPVLTPLALVLLTDLWLNLRIYKRSAFKNTVFAVVGFSLTMLYAWLGPAPSAYHNPITLPILTLCLLNASSWIGRLIRGEFNVTGGTQH